jgi:hypothetical protein
VGESAEKIAQAIWAARWSYCVNGRGRREQAVHPAAPGNIGNVEDEESGGARWKTMEMVVGSAHLMFV